MQLWGKLSVYSGNGNAIAKGYENYFGYMPSGLEGSKDTDGIGFGISSLGYVKTTLVNSGMSFKGNSIFISEQRIQLNHSGYSIALGNYSGKDGISFNCPAEKQYGIYARFA